MSQTLSGAKGSLKLNGVKVAFVAGVNVTRNDDLTRIEVLDQLDSAELAETGHSGNFSANLFKVDANAAELFGLDPANLDDVLSQPELTLEVYNRIGDKVECLCTGVKRSGGSGSMDARGVWQGTWTFEVRRVRYI